MKLVVAFTLGLVCVSCSAQKGALQPHCLQTAKTQMELNVCAGNEAKRANSELNILYRRVLTTVADDPLATKNVMASERAWIIYRDAYLAAMYPLPDTTANYGTAHSMELGLLIASLTHDHIKDLKDLLRNYSPSPER